MAENKNKEAGQLRDLIKRFDEINKNLADIGADFQSLSGSGEWARKNQEEIFSIKRKMRQLEIEQFSPENMINNRRLFLFSPAPAGKIQRDWVSMLYEMYSQYVQKRGWKVKVLDETLGDFQSKTGRHPLKNVSIEIKGDYAYGYLKNESGVHRLVRISPFSPDKKGTLLLLWLRFCPICRKLKAKDLKFRLMI